VRKAGNRIRVSVQLVNVADSSHIWSETYDRTLEDIFAVQDDIAQSVVKELRTALLGGEADLGASATTKAEVAQAAKGRGADPEAHRLYLLARHLADRSTREDTATAIEYLKEALVRDPEFALAWSTLAREYANEAGLGWVPVAEGFGRARKAVERALSLEPDLADGHLRLGWIRMAYDRDFRAAEASFARALELARGDASVLIGAAALARGLGHLDEAITLIHRAKEQDPVSKSGLASLGKALSGMGRLAEAETAYRTLQERSPRAASVCALRSVVLLEMGRGEEALAEATREPEEQYRLWALAIAHHGLGHRAESDAALEELVKKWGGPASFQVAEIHAARHELDDAFKWLDRAYDLRDTGITNTLSSMSLRTLHGDPRWGAFLKKMGLKE
jgi:tetratricopeptide (TPR) repeat protein